MRDLWFFLKLYKQHIGMMLLGILLAIITLLASMGLLALSGWFITASALAGLSLATAQTFNFFTPGAGVRGCSIIRTAGRYGERIINHNTTFQLLSKLRQWFFNHLIPLSLIQIRRYRRGDLLSRLVADIDALDQLYLRLVSPLIVAVIVSILLAVFLAFINLHMAVFGIVVLISWILLMPALFYCLGRKTGEQIGAKEASLRQQILDHFQSMTSNTIYGCNPSSRRRIQEAEQQLLTRQSTMAKIEGLSTFLFIASSGFASIGMLWLGAENMAQYNITGPQLVLSVFIMLASFEALMPLPGAFQFLSKTRTAAGRLKEVIDEPAVFFPLKEEPVVLTGDLHFEDLCFSYGHQTVLHDFSLHIPTGQHIALLGKTGCGKSTLSYLLTRALAPCSGSILMNGRILDSLTEKQLYGAITIVTQKTHVFSATLRDNLLIAAPKTSDLQLIRIMEKTGLLSLGGGQKTPPALLGSWIGQGGIALSGGELRRLSIARALLKPAPVLILDEPTEGLDIQSEETLLNQLLTDFRHSTIIMITHKHVLLGRMDRVYCLESGRAVLQTGINHSGNLQ
ncbi:putative ABC transporter ATP-binding protein [invertebrate metagenome]|uniref:Putative ABC transporter ATP-binding protein n=1 Tax=invertebrate metagenome TaxID=1711999 RepID=A0A2H9T9X4_9ZZZZ